LRADPIGLNGGINLFGYAENNPIASFDYFGLATYICSRKLGGPHKPATSKYRKFRHDYLKIGDEYYSFGPAYNTTKGPGKVTKNRENDRFFKCHTKVCDDERFDKIARRIANSYLPRYSLDACEHNLDTDCSAGYRNCKGWARDVIAKAKKEYIEKYKDECDRCFQ
jgi:hypothetical protein